MSIASARRVVGWILDDRRHYVDITLSGEWVVMHPLSCRMAEGSLLACTVTEKVGRGWRPATPGRYKVEHSERQDKNPWGENVPSWTDLDWLREPNSDFDPIVSRLHLILEHLDHAECMDERRERREKTPYVHIADRTDVDTRPLCRHEYGGHEGPCELGEPFPGASDRDCGRDHATTCCPDHHTHANPHVGCILR